MGEEPGYYKSKPLDVTKEYGLISYYENYSNKNKMANLFNFMSLSLENNHWTFINLEEIQEVMNEQFKYLSLKKRYTALIIESDDLLHCDTEGFHINEHTFETLDEVKRALDNKMFL